MSFSTFNFSAQIQGALRAQGFETPTPIQAQAIPLVMNRKDLIGLAQTGTGKTAAFVLPILERLSKARSFSPRALIIAPTRELAQQIHEVVVDFGKQLQLRSVTIFGGVSMERQVNELRRGADVVVACPGRLLDHMRRKTIVLSKIEMLVLDEADQMFDMGFAPLVRNIIAGLPQNRQTLMFSATMPPEIRRLAQEALKDPLTVKVGQIAPTTKVAHALYPVAAKLKSKLLVKLLEHTDTESVLVFVRTKHRAKNISRLLNDAGFKATALQGNLSQGQRKAAMSGFKDGTFQIMVATDIAARGIDIASISHVINYDIPATTEAYIHRIGRTGRAANTGDALTLIAPEDTSMVRSIENAIRLTIPRKTVPDFDYNARVEETFSPRRGSDEYDRSTRSKFANARPHARGERRYRSSHWRRSRRGDVREQVQRQA